VKRLFENAEVFDPEAAGPRGAALLVEDGRIEAQLEPGEATTVDAERVDLTGYSLAPGFIDLHFHGELVFARGAEFGAALQRSARARPAEGTTAFLATSVAWPGARLRDFVLEMAEAVATGTPGGARAIGIHLEGPWINPEAAGAQPGEAIRACDPREIDELLALAAGTVKLVTLAPEVSGSRALLAALARAGVVAALGHSLAKSSAVDAAIGEGLCHVTHLFNAMGGTRHRNPARKAAYGDDELAGRLLGDDRLGCDLICDGVHVHPDWVVGACRAKGEQLSLISDRVELPAQAAGSGASEFGAGGLRDDGQAIRLADGRLAGSSLSLDRAIRNAVAFGALSRIEAIAACSLRPAKLLGIEAERGTLRPGARADFAILDGRGEVAQTWIGGERVF